MQKKWTEHWHDKKNQKKARNVEKTVYFYMYMNFISNDWQNDWLNRKGSVKLLAYNSLLCMNLRKYIITLVYVLFYRWNIILTDWTPPLPPTISTTSSSSWDTTPIYRYIIVEQGCSAIGITSEMQIFWYSLQCWR